MGYLQLWLFFKLFKVEIVSGWRKHSLWYLNWEPNAVRDILKKMCMCLIREKLVLLAIKLIAVIRWKALVKKDTQ